MGDAAHEIAAKVSRQVCFLADYTGSVIAFDGATLDRVAECRYMPGALVVSPPTLELFLGHSQRMAARGITRRIFTCPERALSWAVRQAALVA